MRRIAVTVSVNILIWCVAIIDYSSMATFVNGVEQRHFSRSLDFIELPTYRELTIPAFLALENEL